MKVSFWLQIRGNSRSGRTMEDLLTQPGQDGKHSDAVQRAISLKVSDHTLMLDNPASARGNRPADANDHSQHLMSRRACKKLDLYSVAGQKGLRCVDAVLDSPWKYVCGIASVRRLSVCWLGLLSGLHLPVSKGQIVHSASPAQPGCTLGLVHRLISGLASDGNSQSVHNKFN